MNIILIVVALSILIVLIPGIHSFLWMAETSRANGMILLGADAYNRHNPGDKVPYTYTEQQKTWLIKQFVLFAIAGYVGCMVALLIENFRGSERFITVLNWFLFTALYLVVNLFIGVIFARKKTINITILGETNTPFLHLISTMLLFVVIVEGMLSYIELNRQIVVNKSEVKHTNLVVSCNNRPISTLDIQKDGILVSELKLVNDNLSVTLTCSSNKP